MSYRIALNTISASGIEPLSLWGLKYLPQLRYQNPSQIIHGKTFMHSLTDLQSFMFSTVFRLQMSAWIEKVACYRGRVGAVFFKKVGRIWGRAVVHLSRTHFHTWNRIPHQAPHLDASDFNPAVCQIHVGHVAVALQSFGQDLHVAALRRGRNGQRLAAPRLHGGNVHESVEPRVFSGEIQLRNAGLVQDSCQGLAMQWRFDGMTWWPCSDLSSCQRCSSFFTSKEPQWTEPYAFVSGPPLDM